MQTLYLLVLLQIETIFVVIENHGHYPKNNTWVQHWGAGDHACSCWKYCVAGKPVSNLLIMVESN